MQRRRWRATDPFDKEFDLRGFERLREFGWCALHDCNLGNRADWYGHFRAGIYGLRARLHGVRIHFKELHAWVPRKRDTEEMDYHLATILFGMDSAVECCTYALNALGCAIAPADFHDVGEDAALRRILPDNILGRPGKPPRPGYATYFPKVQVYWQRQRLMLDEIMAQHDASKHRIATISDSLESRDDPPEGFWESLGITDDFDKQEYTPRANFYLQSQVKEPNAVRQAGRGVTVFFLEEVAKRFRTTIKTTGDLAAEDATATIPLNYSDALAADEEDRRRR